MTPLYRYTRLTALALVIGALAVAAACSTEATAPGVNDRAIHGLSAHRSDLEAAGDTTLYSSCLPWNGCSNISYEDNLNITDISNYLLSKEGATCKLIGQQLAGALATGRIKRGNSNITDVQAIATGAYGNVWDQNGWLVLGPTASTAFENRFILTHEGLHSAQYAGLYGTNPGRPPRGYDSIYNAEIEAYAVEFYCT